MVEHKLAEVDGGIVLDGFPRTVYQATALDRILEESAERSPSELMAVQLAAPEDVLLRRLTGRRVCQSRGHIYHVESNPPSVAGVCDIDGSPLVQREDDLEDTVRRRLEVYAEETGPVVDYYASTGRLRRVEGTGDRSEVADRLVAALLEARV
jgi:adenylate kinase